MFIIPKILLINLTENCQTGPLIIVGPIVLAAAFALLCCSGEICARFRKDLGNDGSGEDVRGNYVQRLCQLQRKLHYWIQI